MAKSSIFWLKHFNYGWLDVNDTKNDFDDSMRSFIKVTCCKRARMPEGNDTMTAHLVDHNVMKDLISVRVKTRKLFSVVLGSAINLFICS